jgi:hypothetical protein
MTRTQNFQLFLSQLNFFSDIIRDEIAPFFDQHLPFLMIMLFFSKKSLIFFSENCEETERRLFTVVSYGRSKISRPALKKHCLKAGNLLGILIKHERVISYIGV